VISAYNAKNWQYNTANFAQCTGGYFESGCCST
jgi:hypothetical protein